MIARNHVIPAQAGIPLLSLVIPAKAGISSGEKRWRLSPAPPSVIPAKAGAEGDRRSIQEAFVQGQGRNWIPAFAGMTGLRRLFLAEIPAFAGMTVK